MLKPLADRVVIKRLEAEQKTASGIVLPDSAKEKPEEGEVVAVGPGRIRHGQREDMSVKVGDKVIFSKYGPTEVKVDGEEYLIVKEEDILAIINS